MSINFLKSYIQGIVLNAFHRRALRTQSKQLDGVFYENS